MQITVESTSTLMSVNDHPVRVWTGKTSKGTPVHALIVRLAVDPVDDASELVAELLEPPTLVEERPPGPGRGPHAKPEDVHYEAARLALDVLEQISHALIVCDGIPKDPRDPFHLAVESIHRILTGAPPLTEPKPAASWLVRDFWALYQTAKATLDIENVDDAVGTRGALREQIRRLAPAFEVCEQERRGAAPSRLTVAEREALAAVHRWRHSPSGDGALMEGTEAFHIQCEAEAPDVCEALEAEEKAARSDTLAERSRTIVDQARKVFSGVMDFAGSGEQPPPVLAARIIKRILEDERSSGDAADPHEAAEFLAAALRASKHGWLARRDVEREAWPRRLEESLAKVEGELAREAWRFGFETALTTPNVDNDDREAVFENLDAVYPVDPASTVRVLQLDGSSRVECDHTFTGGPRCAYCGIPFAVLQRRNAAESRALLERLDDGRPFHVAAEDPPTLMDARPYSPRVERSSWKPAPDEPAAHFAKSVQLEGQISTVDVDVSIGPHALAIEERDRAEVALAAAETEREGATGATGTNEVSS